MLTRQQSSSVIYTLEEKKIKKNLYSRFTLHSFELWSDATVPKKSVSKNHILVMKLHCNNYSRHIKRFDLKNAIN